MNTYASVIDMRAEAVKATELGTAIAMVWEQVRDIIVEVFADAASVIYTAKAGDEIVVTEDVNEFVARLEYALS